MRSFRRIGSMVAVIFGVVAGACGSVADARELDVPFQAIVPNSWTLLPRSPDSLGRRFISPSGDAWLGILPFPSRPADAPLAQEGTQPMRPEVEIG